MEGAVYQLADRVTLPSGDLGVGLSLSVGSGAAGEANLGVYDWGVVFVDLVINGAAAVNFSLQGKLTHDGEWFDLTVHELSAGVDETVQAASVTLTASAKRALLGFTIPVAFLRLLAAVDGAYSATLSAWLKLSE